ncbi:MAG: hydratase [Clostridia bacterium]|nr:hydratase [Clostridia bacterium]
MKIFDKKVFIIGGNTVVEDVNELKLPADVIDGAYRNTLAYPILMSHNVGDEKKLKLKFDALCSHDITYVGIIQTARASGLTSFPVPYVLTNCHNSLCAVGGTINEDDHVFGLSAARKYGGIFVPPNIAVIHQYMREMQAGCGKMILGSDSHTRYGALGTMAIGEGGPELVKQILSRTYDIDMPKTIAIVLKNSPKLGVGPQDVAIKLIGEVFKTGLVKNCVLEFIGDGVNNLSMDYRIGIDVMTTETACLTSIWKTDEKTREYLANVGREADYKELKESEIAMYDGAIVIELDKINPMIAMPFHPSNAYEIAEVIKNPYDVLKEVEENAMKSLDDKTLSLSLLDKIKDGKVYVDQGIIAGCAGGTYENICEAAEILKDANIGNGEYSLSVYPSSLPIYSALSANGAFTSIVNAGGVIKTCFCGPCFGAGDVPSNKGLSIRHSTRNFPMREGAKPSQKQIASVALMDARSIAATSKNKGVLTPATELSYESNVPKFYFNSKIYENRIFDAFEKGNEKEELVLGPNITSWPEIKPLKDNVLLKCVSVILDEVTTTDELIPSGETSSYRSNPMKLAEFALSRKDPAYVGEAKKVKALAEDFENGCENEELKAVLSTLNANKDNTTLSSFIFANKPGDGSAREQAASCQRVLGGGANVAKEYATKRYRSNLINWGMLPLRIEQNEFAKGDYLFIENVIEKLENKIYDFEGTLISGSEVKKVRLTLDPLTKDETDIIISGCLMNYYNKTK